MFFETIQQLCDQRKISVSKLAADLNLSNSTSSKWKKGALPDTATLMKIAVYFGVPIDYLVFDHDDDYYRRAAWNAAGDVEKKYRALDEHGKKIVGYIVEEEYRRISEVETAHKESKIIPLFGTSAAAGPGEPDTELPWENYDVPEDSRAEFAVRITGDSMEPELEDGHIALCVKRRPEIGELAVIMVNGSLLVKQYIRDNYGNVYLRSLNRARQDCDYDIRATGNDTVLCYGTVIVGHRVPLVD